MLEVKDNKLIIDGIVKDLKDVNLINSKSNAIYFSNNMVERIKSYPYSIEEVYKVLENSGINTFWLVNNTIINLNNIERVYIKYYQYAGLSIVETLKENAETCFVNIVCKNGKTESISFTNSSDVILFNFAISNIDASLNCFIHFLYAF